MPPNNLIELIFYQSCLLEKLKTTTLELKQSLDQEQIDYFSQVVDQRGEMIILINQVQNKIIKELPASSTIEALDLIKTFNQDMLNITNQVWQLDERINEQAIKLQEHLKNQISSTFMNRTKLSKFHSQNVGK